MSPATITLLALAPGIGAAWLAWRGWYGAALACWLVNRALDGLDGALARARDLQSDRGGYLDLLADFIVYALIPIALAERAATLPEAGGAARAAALWLLASFYVNAMTWMYIAAVLERRAPAQRQGATSIAMPDAVIGGTETILFYSAFLLFPSRLVPLFIAMAILTAAGAGYRTIWAMRRL